MNYLVTGVAGFIGSAVANKLLKQGHSVIGVDNLNDYYDVSLKNARLENIPKERFRFIQCDISDLHRLEICFIDKAVDIVIHLAAQAGVRYSIDNPFAYAESNIIGHLNILECCKKFKVTHLVYASSSSVYGANESVPFKVSDRVDHPISFYAATKKANELMSHSYSHLYGIPTTGLRFFTVYGPWGRPDMAPYIFADKILKGEEIQVNNYGDMWRDFTYVDDIVEGVLRIAELVPGSQNALSLVTKNSLDIESKAPYSVYNIGLGNPVNLMDFIRELEINLGKNAKICFRGMQPGDVYKTYADTSCLSNAINYKPKINLEEGVRKFSDWFKCYQANIC